MNLYPGAFPAHRHATINMHVMCTPDADGSKVIIQGLTIL